MTSPDQPESVRPVVGVATDLLQADPFLAEMVRRLVDAVHPERIYLYGSRARGDARPDSDYDLLAVVASSDLPPHKRDLPAVMALVGVGASTEAMVWTREEFDGRAGVVTSLPATILREGKLLYVA
ncbi:MAG: nucleotidyltransferase domain-containing protein [Candidatus Sericytochromatia bacterium]|nr:nucleotidyltransferase domain-containing protein [Candidatus Tanganyikabacteria bacterium]